MPRFKKTPEIFLTYFRENYPKMSLNELVESFNKKFGQQKTKIQVRSLLGKYKIKSGRSQKDRMMPSRVYSEEHLEFLNKNFKTMDLKTLVKAFNDEFGLNKTKTQIHGVMNRYKIRANRPNKFLPGHKPWNAGTKGLVKGNQTSFKKGSGVVPLGHERLDKDGNVLIKVDKPCKYTGYPHSFRKKSHVLFEKYHGKIPKGHIVIFKNSDITDFSPENLISIPRAQQIFLNKMQYSAQPKEVKPTLLLLSEVQSTIAERKKEL